jgi:hypothetical protein
VGSGKKLQSGNGKPASYGIAEISTPARTSAINQGVQKGLTMMIK